MKGKEGEIEKWVWDIVGIVHKHVWVLALERDRRETWRTEQIERGFCLLPGEEEGFGRGKLD